MKTTIRSIALLLLLAVACFGQVSMTIANGQTTSTAVTTGPSFCTPAAIIVPAGWTGGTSLALKASLDKSTFYAMKDEYGAAKSITVSAGAWVILTPSELWSVRSVRHLQVVAGTVTREETLTVVCK